EEKQSDQQHSHRRGHPARHRQGRDSEERTQSTLEASAGLSGGAAPSREADTPPLSETICPSRMRISRCASAPTSSECVTHTKVCAFCRLSWTISSMIPE